MTERKIIKKNARDVLANNIFSEKWLLLALLLFVYSLILSVTVTIGAYTFGLGSILELVIGGALELGVTRALIGVVTKKDEKADFNKLLSGFDKTFTKTLVHNLLKTLFIALWTLLLVIPGIIKYYAYSLSYYCFNENNDLEWNECLKKSQEKMKGYKMKLFVLDLSFIGWYIVGLLCLGIGVFFVQPYHQAARTLFLLEVLNDGKEVDELNTVSDEVPREETTEETKEEAQEE